MPADRLLHPRAGHSRKVSSLTDLQYRVWTQYLLSADDFGILPLSAVAVQRDSDYLAEKPARVVLKCLEMLVTVLLLRTFDHQGKTYLYQHDWQDWQKVRWPAKTIHPQPPDEHLTDATKELLKIFPGGKKVPPKNFGSTSEELPPTRETANGLRQTADLVERVSKGKTGPRDVWFRELLVRYPSNRVSSGHSTEAAFNQQFEEDVRDDAEVWADMMAGLDSQSAGYEWRVKGMTPKLEKWLREGLWKQRHEVAPASTVLSDRTARTLASGAAFVKAGDRDTH